MLPILATMILCGAPASVAAVQGDQFPDDFQTVLGLIESAELEQALVGMDGQFTLLAPNDKAFEKLPAGALDELKRPENAALLKAILQYHVVPKRVPYADALEKTSAPTVEGSKLTLELEGETLKVDGALITSRDQDHQGGIVHGIDTVLVPAKLGKSLTAPVFGCSQVFELIELAGLKDTLAEMAGGYTLFAPNDLAFAALPQDTRLALIAPENREQLKQVLLHHVLASRVDEATARSLAEGSGDEQGARITLLHGWAWLVADEGGGLSLGGNAILRFDRPHDPGLVHIIGKVMIPEDVTLKPVAADAAKENPPKGDRGGA